MVHHHLHADLAEAGPQRERHHTGPQVAGRGVTIPHLGVAYGMEPFVVHRPKGTDEHLVMVFHDPAWVEDETGWRLREACWIHWLPGQEHHYGHIESVWTHSWSHFTGPLSVATLAGVPANRCLTLPEPGWGLRLLINLSDRVRHERDPVLVGNAVEDWLRVLASATTASNAAPPAIAAARWWLETHWAEPLRLADVAARHQLSPSALVNGFRRWYATTPRDFLTRLRCDQAILLLREPGRPVADIAGMVGFEDPFHFSRVLRRVSGRGPRAWREHWGIG